MSRLNDFFPHTGAEPAGIVGLNCPSMWQAYLAVIQQRARKDLHLPARFRLAASLKKVSDVRAVGV